MNKPEHKEYTQIIQGLERTTEIIQKFLSKATKIISCCTEGSDPSVAIGVEGYKKGLIKAIDRGVKIRFLTEINDTNLHYFKKLAKIAEIRHLEGIRSNFSVSEGEYIGSVVLQDSSPVPQLIHSNAKAVVEQQQYVFDILWGMSVPALRRIEQIERGLPNEKTEVLYGEEQVIKAIVEWQYNSEKKWDLCLESNVPHFSMSERIRKGYLDARDRGIRIRYLTEITKDNLEYCKEIMNFGQVRHLERLIGNFVVSEKEYLGEATGKQFLSHLIYSNNKEMVEQQNYIFENLWNNGIDAEKQIKMIEQGTPPVETRIIENPDKIADKIKTEILNSNEIIACYQPGRLELIHDNFFDLYKEVLDRQSKGKHKGIKLIVTLDKDILELVKHFVKAGVQVRHVRNLLPLSFVVTDREVQANLEDIKGRKIIHSLLTSNEPVYVKQFASVFEQLWKEGIDAKLKIKDLEEGSENEIEVIQNPSRALELYFHILDIAKHDILLIFPTIGAIARQEKLGILNRVRAAAEDRHVNVRIMAPFDLSPIAALADLIKDEIKEIGIRFIETVSGRATVLIVDKRISLVMELKDDSKENFSDAVGLSTYSNSKAGVLSYIAMFENLWSQTDLMDKLKVHDRMQKEFINVAAHELRTPIQPILSLTEALRSDVTSSEGQEMLNIIIRNAERLRQLAENILDVTRIESQTFRLTKENFSLDEILTRIMTDCREVVKRSRSNLELTLEPESNETFVEADKSRIAQVVTNLITNAIRFTKRGNVSVAVTKGKANDIVVSIRDTGQGIDPEIIPRLFTKFVTKSVTGTGLGLFISKNIIEAHGGSIWAENNLDGRGATFTFTIPMKVS